MKAEVLLNDLIEFFEANAEERIVLKYSRYFKEGYDAYGISTDLFEQKINELIANPAVTLDLILATAPKLIEHGKFELTSFAILLTAKKKKEFTPQTFELIEQWFSLGINNWAHADTLSSELLPHFFKKNIVPLERLSSWRSSTYKYQRRVVPVTLIKLLNSTQDFQPLFDFISPLMLDQERVVHQGLGWFLREAWKKQPEITEQFLYKWKNHSARLIFQYATEKMEKEKRLQFRKEK